MTEPVGSGPTGWEDAELAAALCAIAPSALGGVVLKALPGPVRDSWLSLFRGLLPAGAPFRRIPLHIAEDRLLGGLDLSATLKAGRPIAERGLLAESTGGMVVLAMAERASRSTVAHLAAVLDFGELILERDGMASRSRVEIGAIALDEGLDSDEQLSPVLRDRLALHLDLRALGIHDLGDPRFDSMDVESARARLSGVRSREGDLEALCGAALALGIESMRACLLAIRVARTSAALAGRDAVGEPDLAVAARLVLAPRAIVFPEPEEPEAQETAEPSPPPDQAEPEASDDSATDRDRPLEDRVLDAASAAIPDHLLDRLRAAGRSRVRAQAPGKSGVLQRTQLRGRPMGVVRGLPRGGARLSLIETLRAAAPWQTLRRAELAAGEGARTRVLVRRDDLRTIRFKQRSETTTIFAVDASGSAALHRLAEAKGAVELLLADCYVRRDQVALIAFRGQEAEMLLPPTRSLVRAKRSLAALPGGGGTPLAAGIEAAAALADLVQRRGGTPSVVLLTDGRANVGRDGAQGRERAFDDALHCAAALRLAGVRSMVIDTSPRPHRNAEQLADAMAASYLPLPHADATTLLSAVQDRSGANPAGASRMAR
ncbi:MAG: magnesium chelatase subunit D [Chromatiales bacterium]